MNLALMWVVVEFFFGCLEQIFPYELPRLAESAASNIFSYFV